MNDDRVDRYLFDPAAEPADEVKELEDALATLRYDAASHPLPLFRPRRSAWRLLAAAAVLVVVIAGAAAWVWTWPRGESWHVASGPFANLAVGETVHPASSTRVRIARIGWMDVAARSAVTLLSTRSNQHRVAMSEGQMHVSVWAPPRSISVRTPSGEVVDLGCEFIIDVDARRTAVDVVSGWVQLDNGAGNVVVPGGATSEMTPSGRPSIPVFRSAATEFREAIRQLDDRADLPAALDVALHSARRRDVFTLLILAMRRAHDRDTILTRAAALYPPRDEETVLHARRGDNDAVMQWVNDLPLPPERAWIRNWRDAFPSGRAR